MLQSTVNGWKTSGGVAHGASLEQLCRQNQAVQRRVRLQRGGSFFNQALASVWCDVLRLSSRSTAFIMIDGVVSALALDTVK